LGRHEEGSMTFEGYITWIKTHEKLIIIAALVLFGLHVYDSARQAWVDHDKRLADQAREAAQISSLQSIQVQEQLADLKKQVDAANASLKASEIQRSIDTQKQKQADDALAGQQLAARLQALLAVMPQDVTWSPTQGNLTFSLLAAHTVADVVDDKNKLTADVQGLQTELKNDESVLAKQTDAIVSGNIALADEKKSHEKDINLLNVEMKTQWRKGFKWGIIVGVIGTVIVEQVFHVKL
jgi:hypothetical protein